MSYAYPTHNSVNPVRLEPPVYMANGPMYVIYYPCPCGLEPCVQPVLVNSHHIRSLQAAQQGGVINIPPPVADNVIPNVLDQYVIPNQQIRNELAADYVVDQEPERLEYPVHPEGQQQERRRRTGARRSRKIESDVSLESDESEIDR